MNKKTGVMSYMVFVFDYYKFYNLDNLTFAFESLNSPYKGMISNGIGSFTITKNNGN